MRDADNALDNVLTVTEAAWMWCRHRDTIMMQVWRGKVDYRQSTITGQYLIFAPSLWALYGAPPRVPAIPPPAIPEPLGSG